MALHLYYSTDIVPHAKGLVLVTFFVHSCHIRTAILFFKQKCLPSILCTNWVFWVIRHSSVSCLILRLQKKLQSKGLVMSILVYSPTVPCYFFQYFLVWKYLSHMALKSLQYLFKWQKNVCIQTRCEWLRTFHYWSFCYQISLT